MPEFRPRADQRSDLRLFVWLFLAGAIGVAVGVPFTLAVLRDPTARGSIDSQTLWLSALGEVFLLLAPASAVGVWLRKKVGFDLRPPQGGASAGEAQDRARSFLLPSIAFGLVLGLPNLAAMFALPADAFGAGLANPTAFDWLLRSLSAALTEEIFFRLGLMTLFVWLMRMIVKRPEGDKASMWAGNLLSALAFGAAHLPPLLLAGAPDWGMVFIVLFFNTIGGLALGWLYARYGLVSAIIAHFIADAVRVIPLTLAMVTLSPGR